MPTDKPLVYACSGVSSAAQLANAVALALHRGGDAEMSCIAGVGGDVPALVRTATSGRPVVSLDGCPLRCVHSALARHGVAPAVQVDLGTLGVAKIPGAEFEQSQALEVLARVREQLPGR